MLFLLQSLCFISPVPLALRSLLSEEMLGRHESILTCQTLHLQVSLRLLHQDHVKETLARDVSAVTGPFCCDSCGNILRLLCFANIKLRR